MFVETPTLLKLSETYTNSVLHTEQLRSDPVTVYVDPNGDDANDGLSADTPKATINAAINDAPFNANYSDQLTVEVAAGTCTGENRLIYLDPNPPGHVHIKGEVDGSGNPASVLDAENTHDEVAFAKQTHVTLENVKLQNAVKSNIKADGARFDLANCTLLDAGERNIWAHSNAIINDDANCKYDITGSTSPFNNMEINGAGSYMSISGDVIGGSSDIAIRVKQNAGLLFDGYVDADGARFGIAGLDGVDIYVSGATLDNYTTAGVQVLEGGQAKAVASPTFNGSGDNMEAGDGGYVRDETTGAYWRMPDEDSQPGGLVQSPRDNGALIFNNNSGRPEVYVNSLGWLEFGADLLDTGTVSVSAGGTASINIAGSLSPLRVDWYPKNSGGVAKVQMSIEKDTNKTYPDIVWEETGGSAGCDIEYRVYRTA